MRRMASAAAPKKCARLAKRWSPRRNQASWTSAVACRVCPGCSRAIFSRAELAQLGIDLREQGAGGIGLAALQAVEEERGSAIGGGE